MASAKTTARFIPPMLLLRRDRLPEGPEWLYELKLDGYRALAINTGGKVGEIVALDEAGRPSFNSLQNYGSAGAALHFFIFDVLMLKGKDLMGDPLMKQRELIEEHAFPKLAEPIRYSRSSTPL